MKRIGISITVVGSIIAVVGLCADPLVPDHLEPFAAGVAFAGIVELTVGIFIYIANHN